MNKLLLLSVLACNFAMAGGQEGTGSNPEDVVTGASSLEELDQYVLVCTNDSVDKNSESTYCVLVKKSQ